MLVKTTLLDGNYHYWDTPRWCNHPDSEIRDRFPLRDADAWGTQPVPPNTSDNRWVVSVEDANLHITSRAFDNLSEALRNIARPD